MGTPLRVLIVEDSEDDTVLLLRELRHGGYDPTWERIDTAEAMKAALARQSWEIVLSDYAMPRFSAPAALSLLRESGLDVPIIIVSGAIGEDTAVAAMKAGAHDYIMKRNLVRLVPAIARELREAEIRREHRWAEETLRLREEQLRQALKMEAIGRLVAGVSHHFNNLMTVISIYTELLLRSLGANDLPRQYAEEIKKATGQAGSLTRQLLTFSRRQVVQPTVIDLNALVADMEAMLRRLLGEDIDLRLALDPGWGYVKVDPSQMEQVIMHLVANARDAMPRGGSLSLGIGHSELNEAYAAQHIGVRPGPYVMLTVRDTGGGMDMEIQSHLFEPFFTTKEPGKGTGLGLSTVYGIVTQSGGHIEVDSAPGRGTIFMIYLPQVTEPPPVSETRSRAVKPWPGGETILLLEDEAMVREVVQRVLLSAGYTVLEAPHPDQALLISEQHQGPIHLLLTDVVMPGMSGPEVAQRLALLRPHMKVLYMSGYMHDVIVQHSILDADKVLLQKPFTPAVLVRKVREVLGGDPTQA